MRPLSETSNDAPELGEFQLGPWRVLQAEGTLSSDGRTVRLEPRVMDVLAYLAAHRERIVPKEELIAAVWGDTFVEEGALSQAVHSLRKALGDDARQPRYIQTLPKRGYRLVAPVVEGYPATISQEANAEETASGMPPAWPQPALTGHNYRRAGILLIALGLAILAVVWVSSARPRNLESPGPPALETGATRVVVLPFENLDNRKEAYFADGLTEEITKDLASLSSLHVISRTSALHYKGAGKSLPEIGRELKVDYVLEGTVRWSDEAGDRPRRVRIALQLVRVADDVQVWSESFDREVEDIFEVQTELSQRVIGRLGVNLLPEEKRTLRRPPTASLEAYQAYLRGLELRNQPYYSEEHIRQAIPMFERAVELDPEFAEAWAELSQTHSYLAFNAESAPARVEEARKALDRALELAPDLDAVRLAQGYFAYRCLRDYKRAHELLAAASRLSPNNPEILQALGLVLRRQGRLAEAITTFERSFSFDPRTVKLVWAIAETYAAQRDYEQADRSFARAIALAPDRPIYWEERAANRFAWSGDVDEARAVVEEAPISEDPELVMIAVQFDLYQRDYRRALARVSARRLQELEAHTESRVALLVATARERMGDRVGARAGAEANRANLEVRLDRFPNDAFYRGYLALALAQLGRRDEALAEAEKAVRQRRDDAFSGPRLVEIQAMVDAVLGRRREAVGRLARLLTTPYQCPISIEDLRLNPIWDSLRGDPEFEALLRQAQD